MTRQLQQHFRLLYCVSLEDRRTSLEIQHRRRRVLLTFHVYGQRRAVRHRGLGWRRSRATGWRFDLELRVTETLTACSSRSMLSGKNRRSYGRSPSPSPPPSRLFSTLLWRRVGGSVNL